MARFNQRRRNGRFGRMSCVELGLIREDQVACRPMICGKCGHEWAPLITTGKCPNCGNQEGHKFKDQTANK